LSICDTLLKGLAQHFQSVAATLWQLIYNEHALVLPRSLARHHHLATDLAPIRMGMMRGTSTARGHS